jgi:hypothetical protein
MKQQITEEHINTQRPGLLSGILLGYGLDDRAFESG